MPARPTRRADDLIVRTLGDEVVIYDTRTDTAHNLTPTVAGIWERCDGESTVQQIASALSLDAATVTAGIDQLSAAGLVDAGMGRRTLLKAGATVGAGAVALPAMSSVLAPSAFAAVSPIVGPGGSGTLFSEDFNGAPSSGGYQNYGPGPIAGTQFSVTSGDVDIVAGGNFGNSFPDNAVDLDGNGPGEITSDPIAVTAGTTYVVGYDYAGSGRGTGTNDFTVSVTNSGGASQSYTVTDTDGPTSDSFSFVATSNSVQIVITSNDGGGNAGVYVDNVVLTT